MALSDITYGGTYSVLYHSMFDMSINRGNIGTVSSIEYPSNGLVLDISIHTSSFESSQTFVS